MNEWKWVGVFSLIVNVLLVGLLFTAVLFVKGIITDKDDTITRLQKELAEQKELPAVVETEGIFEEEPQQETEKEQPQQVETEQVTTQQRTPKKEMDYKEKLLSYQNVLDADFENIYYLFDGWGPVDELSNAEQKAAYEDAYKMADKVLNKVYGILEENLPANEFSKLRNEQRAWLKELNESNEARYAAGGSSAGTDVAYNLAIKTQERTVELLVQYFGYEYY